MDTDFSQVQYILGSILLAMALLMQIFSKPEESFDRYHNFLLLLLTGLGLIIIIGTAIGVPWIEWFDNIQRRRM
jgi:hypothetical protein